MRAQGPRVKRELVGGKEAIGSGGSAEEARRGQGVQVGEVKKTRVESKLRLKSSSTGR